MNNIIKIYMAHGDGGEMSIGPVIGYYRSHTSAASAVIGSGWYGGTGHVSEGHAVQLENGQWYLLANSGYSIDLDGEQAKLDAKLREQALGKLSNEEKRVLGIK